VHIGALNCDVTGRKLSARECLILCPKCTKIHLRASASLKNVSGGYMPGHRYEGKRRGKGRERVGVEGREDRREEKGREGRM
jgi:hypothetical protein